MTGRVRPFNLCVSKDNVDGWTRRQGQGGDEPRPEEIGPTQQSGRRPQKTLTRCLAEHPADYGLSCCPPSVPSRTFLRAAQAEPQLRTQKGRTI